MSQRWWRPRRARRSRRRRRHARGTDSTAQGVWHAGPHNWGSFNYRASMTHVGAVSSANTPYPCAVCTPPSTDDARSKESTSLAMLPSGPWTVLTRPGVVALYTLQLVVCPLWLTASLRHRDILSDHRVHYSHIIQGHHPQHVDYSPSAPKQIGLQRVS